MYHHTCSGWKMLKESEGEALVSLLCSVLFQDALLGFGAVWAELIYRTPMVSQGLTRSQGLGSLNWNKDCYIMVHGPLAVTTSHHFHLHPLHGMREHVHMRMQNGNCVAHDHARPLSVLFLFCFCGLRLAFVLSCRKWLMNAVGQQV